MMKNRKIVILKGMTVAMMLAVGAQVTPTSAGAQDWGIDRAERLEAEAEGLIDQRSSWDKAAWLYRGAARLRPVGDPEAVIDLQMAGRLSYYSGDVEQSARDLEAAGKRAMEGGDLLTAGQILTDAAWVARKNGSIGDARRLAYKAQSLVSHPVLSDQVRALVLDRIIDGEGAAVAVADFAPASLELGPELD